MTMGGSHLNITLMKLTTMLGVARWPQHSHLHFNKNVDEKEKHEGVQLKPLNPIMQDHNERKLQYNHF
jgi:hypothetical protein